MAASCRKYVASPGLPKLTGKWYLQRADRYDYYNWQQIYTGYENGSFTFYANGDASYADVLGVLYGNWDMYPVSEGYYDGHGNYHQGYHNVFRVTMYDGYHQPEINWQFDDAGFNGGGAFTATYYTTNYQYVYSFLRE